MTNLISFITAATVLTACGWGIGYLIGKWHIRCGERRKVRKWLAAEKAWKLWRLDEAIERRAREIHEAIAPSGCRPGFICWQGCPNCRPSYRPNGDGTEVYKTPLDGGYYRYREYRNGRLIKEWYER